MIAENMQKQLIFRSVRLPFFFIILAVITGCSTVPKTVSSSQTVNRLPENQTVYVKIDVHSNIEMLSAILNIEGIQEEALQAALERTSDVLFSLLLKENGDREFSFIASGEYPAGIVKRMLKKNDCLKLIANHHWWHTEYIGGLFPITHIQHYLLRLKNY